MGEQRLWQLLHPALKSEFPALIASDAQRHNLPPSSTPFLGRGEEIQNWLNLLGSDDVRLLTLTGFGGLGKTRSALRLAELSLDDFSDGVWWVPLENATTGEEMIARIAEQLIKGLRPQPSVRDQLLNFLRDRELLLVLDNLEQIERSDAAKAVVELLQAAPRLKILATSRRTLEIPSERVIELNPFTQAEAEALFIERAQARSGRFDPQPYRDDIAHICNRLEGVALAIEIAASRTVLMTPTQIAANLNDQLRLLTSRDPHRPPRQQALRGAIEWSDNLLEESSRELFFSLSVFTGGFTLEAATAISGGDAMEVLDTLMELRQQSLLRTFDESEGEARLRMLEAVREYAGEKLQQSRRLEETRQRHAEYFAQWTQDVVKKLHTREESEALALLEAEFDNMRHALAWCAGHNPALAANLAVAFHQPLQSRGLWDEAARVLEIAWQAVQSLPLHSGVLQIRAQVRHYQAGLMQDLGQLEKAHELAGESLENFCEAEDVTGAASTLNLLMLLATENGEFGEARDLGNEALELWPVDEIVGRAKTLHNMARLAQRDDAAEARRLYEESLKLRREAGDDRGAAITLGNLGALSQHENNFEEARRFYRESLKLRRQLREPFGIAVMLNNLADLDAIENNFLRAIILFIHAERIFTELQSPYASEAQKGLQQIKERLSEAEYGRLYQEAAPRAWEDVIEL